jgi:Fe-S cluster assembly scaffold protein SufB
MERISDEALFYLRSRGLEKENALNMILEAKLTDLFTCLVMYDKEFYNELKQNILTKI